MLLFLFANCIKINHNCYSLSNSINAHPNQKIDYIISCPKNKIQSIFLNNSNSYHSLSIYNESNVFVICPFSYQKYDKIDIHIFGHANITFENLCIFNLMEIHDSPSISFSINTKMSIEKINLHNQSYIIPSELKNNNQLVESQMNKNLYYECLNDSLYISLDHSYADILCQGKFQLQINYNNFSNFQFFADNNSIIIQKEGILEKDLDKNIEIILKSLVLNNRKDIIFENFTNTTAVESYIKMLPKDVELWMEIDDYEINDTKCIWDDTSFTDLEYWEKMIFNTKWRKACINNIGMLHYNHDDEKLTIIYIHKFTFIFVFVSIICLFFFIIISSCFIALCRYKLKNKVNNDEFSLSDT